MVNVLNKCNFEQNYALTELILLQIYHGSNNKISIFEGGKPIFSLFSPSPWTYGLCGKKIDGMREQTSTIQGEMCMKKLVGRAGLEPRTFSATQRPRSDSITNWALSFCL